MANKSTRCQSSFVPFQFCLIYTLVPRSLIFFFFSGSLPGLQRGECVCISLSIDLSIHTARLRDPFEQCNDRWQELGWRELPNQFVCSTWYCKALREALARFEVPDATDAFTSELELPQKRLTHHLVLGIAHPIQSSALHHGKLSTFPISIYSCNIVQGQKYRKITL